MKLDIDYSNDARWEVFDRDRSEFTVPNIFIDVLMRYAGKIKRLKNINHAIETGTFMGKTTSFLAAHFNVVHTVELVVTEEKKESYNNIRKQFPNIEWYKGSSDLALVDILKANPDTTFFFLLDAHDCQLSPLKDELVNIKTHSNKKDHVIIIDDCVDLGSGNWPTEQEMRDLLLDINPKYTVENTGIGRDIYIAY